MPEMLECDKLKITILKTLSDKKSYTYYSLRKQTGSSYDTLKPNCNFLERLELIKTTTIPKEQRAVGKDLHDIKITNKGLSLSNKLNSVRNNK